MHARHCETVSEQSADVTSSAAGKLGMFRRNILKWTDKRVGLMNEIINGIQMIKFYAWERSFTAEVSKARSEEAKILKTTALWQGTFGVVLFSGPVAVAIFCFGSYALAGKALTPSKVSRQRAQKVHPSTFFICPNDNLHDSRYIFDATWLR